jgi:hypothetical protein
MVLDDDLSKIIENEFENAFKILDELSIIKYIEEVYRINYKKPKLKIKKDEILENNSLFKGEYSPFENKIIFSKKAIKEDIDGQLKILSYKKIKRYINNTQNIEYLNISYNLKFLYPFYINKRNIRKAIAKAIILSAIFHEIWHSIDFNILDSLTKDLTIKDRDHLLTIFYNPYNQELRASAFEVVMYYLANGFYKYKKGYIAAYKNIPICREYIEKLNINEYINRIIFYELGFCYGNIIVAAYKSSLKENIYNIIDDIVYLDKERAIDVIKFYGDNPNKLLHD